MKSIEYDSPCGRMRLAVDRGAVCAVDWVEDAVTLAVEDDAAAPEDAALLNDLLRQLEDYFSGERHAFTLPLKTSGTEFQESVWHELRKIPYGATVSYSEIARRTGRPTAVRAVAHAIHCNPIGIVIPCHRVIAANGKLAGFAAGLEVKRFLLALEQQNTALL